MTTEPLAPLPDELPSARRILLPARAFLLSWKHQNLVARQAALEDARAHALADHASPGAQDMALLLVIGEAMQALEDLAYLGTAWDRPYQGIATYVRATSWGRFTAN